MVSSPLVTGAQRDEWVGSLSLNEIFCGVKTHNEYMCSVTWDSV